MKHGIMSSFIVAGFLTLTSLATVASADLPPPDGTKFVNFAFTLDGTNAAKDYVFLAYQCDAKDAAALFALESGKPLKFSTIYTNPRRIH